jgi:hypothetical protein
MHAKGFSFLKITPHTHTHKTADKNMYDLIQLLHGHTSSVTVSITVTVTVTATVTVTVTEDSFEPH